MPAEPTPDAEALLRGARRPLVLGMGGGGDVVGALATAEHARRYDGADPMLGGVSWERRPIDPRPGPRSSAEIEGIERELAPGVLLAGPQTRVKGRGILFAESRMAAFLGRSTLLVDPHVGPALIAEGLARATVGLGCDLIVFIDVGGDVLAQGNEPGLRSPLCDAIMLAAAARLQRRGVPVLLGVFGTGCDAELTPAEVLALVAKVARRGGLLGARGLTASVADRVQAAAGEIPTEASALAVRAFRGDHGVAAIRGGRQTLELTALASMTLLMDAAVTVQATGRLARAVDDAHTLAEANAALNALGVRTELDLENQAPDGPER